LCLVAQVLTVGLAYFYQAEWWRLHIWLVRGYSGLPLILTVWAYLNPLPQRIRSLTSSLLILLGLQFLTIHLKSPLPLGVVHPLIGFSLFSASTTLVHRSFHMAFPQSSLSISSEHEQDSEHA
jgi:heme A synthase